ncbi:MAG: hypothetical protein HUU20_25885 [Pirellulales bacterium]|nr:hypothetical protein [Pirellulales bacterium]
MRRHRLDLLALSTLLFLFGPVGYAVALPVMDFTGGIRVSGAEELLPVEVSWGTRTKRVACGALPGKQSEEVVARDESCQSMAPIRSKVSTAAARNREHGQESRQPTLAPPRPSEVPGAGGSDGKPASSSPRTGRPVVIEIRVEAEQTGRWPQNAGAWGNGVVE